MAQSSILHVTDAKPTALSFATFLVACAILLFLIYRRLLPQPIPGIPYNKSAMRLLGDMPDMMSYIKDTQEVWPWVAEQMTKHQSPVVQVFARPFSKPWVIMADHQESQDVLLRRTKDFDRADFTADVFSGLVPDMHFIFKSSDARLKTHRNLLKDLMTPAFLHEVAARRIYANTETFVELWDIKTRMANDHAFQAGEDIFNIMLDVIFATTFGLEVKDSNTSAQLQQLSTTKSLNPPLPPNELMPFPQFRRPAAFDAIATLTDSLETATKSPLPRLAHWTIRQMPYMRKARADKEKLFTDMVNESVRRQTSEKQAKASALDDILLRETAAAKKEARATDYHNRAIYDEVSLIPPPSLRPLICKCRTSHSNKLTALRLHHWGARHYSNNVHVDREIPRLCPNGSSHSPFPSPSFLQRCNSRTT